MRETQSMFRCLQLEIGEDAETDAPIESEKRTLPHAQEKIFDAVRRCEDNTQVIVPRDPTSRFHVWSSGR